MLGGTAEHAAAMLAVKAPCLHRRSGGTVREGERRCADAGAPTCRGAGGPDWREGGKAPPHFEGSKVCRPGRGCRLGGNCRTAIRVAGGDTE